MSANGQHKVLVGRSSDDFAGLWPDQRNSVVAGEVPVHEPARARRLPMDGLAGADYDNGALVLLEGSQRSRRKIGNVDTVLPLGVRKRELIVHRAKAFELAIVNVGRDHYEKVYVAPARLEVGSDRRPVQIDANQVDSQNRLDLVQQCAKDVGDGSRKVKPTDPAEAHGSR